jgi:hypothetical protein
MDYYAIAKFFHMAGALGIFVTLGLEWTGLWSMQRAKTADQLRKRLRLLTGVGWMGIASMTTILISGFYMMATVWGGVAWLLVALGALVLLIGLGLGLTGPRIAAIRRTVSIESGAVSPALHDLLHHPLLSLSVQTRVTVTLGIVFLMTVKPDLSASLLVIGVAITLGLLSALPTFGRKREAPAKQPG